MTKNRKEETILTILSLWEKNQDSKEKGEAWLKYKQILEEAKNLGLSQRTVVRYLNTLVNEGKLEKNERGYKKTYYRPTKDFWAEIEHYNQQYRISEKSLEPIGKYVMDTLRKTITETKNIEEDYREVWEKIVELSSDNCDTTPAFTQAMGTFIKNRKLDQKEKKELDLLVSSLFNGSIIQSLTNPLIFARVEEKDELPAILEEDVWSLVKSFIDLWTFVYKHPGAVLELEDLRISGTKGPSKIKQDKEK